MFKMWLIEVTVFFNKKCAEKPYYNSSMKIKVQTKHLR